jgi:hypothetical protein
MKRRERFRPLVHLVVGTTLIAGCSGSVTTVAPANGNELTRLARSVVPTPPPKDFRMWGVSKDGDFQPTGVSTYDQPFAVADTKLDLAEPKRLPAPFVAIESTGLLAAADTQNVDPVNLSTRYGQTCRTGEKKQVSVRNVDDELGGTVTADLDCTKDRVTLRTKNDQMPSTSTPNPTSSSPQGWSALWDHIDLVKPNAFYAFDPAVQVRTTDELAKSIFGSLGTPESTQEFKNKLRDANWYPRPKVAPVAAAFVAWESEGTDLIVVYPDESSAKVAVESVLRWKGSAIPVEEFDGAEQSGRIATFHFPTGQVLQPDPSNWALFVTDP